MAESYDKRFSEDAYATKEDVANAFNVTSADFIWNQVVNYRKRLTATLELPNIDRTKFSLVYTQSITNRLLSFERMLTKCFFDYNALTSFGKKCFRDKRLIKVLGNVAASAGAKQSDSFLTTLIENNISTIPNDAVVVDNYLIALRYMENHDAGILSYADFNALNEICTSGAEPLNTLEEKTYRKTQLEEPHYYQKGYIYKAALVERIDEMMDGLVNFLNDESLFVSVRALAALYYVAYVKPYEYLNEMLSSLAFKLALSRSGFSQFASFINIEGLVLFKDSSLSKCDENVQKNFDLTYFFDYALTYLGNEIQEIKDDLVASQKEEVEEESKSVGLSGIEKEQMREAEPESLAQGIVKTPDILKPETPSVTPAGTVQPATDNSPAPQPSVGSVQIYGKVDVALPVFPSGFGAEDIEKVTTDLMETYPTLRKSQAHFYASHCTIGRSYTIQEFKKSEDTSYETARTSMDYLAQLGFYEKAKIRNKFVYRPIPRR